MEINTTNQDQGLLPNFCDVTTLFMLVLLVELLALVFAMVASEFAGFWNRLAMISLFTQWIALVNAALLCKLRNWLNAQQVTVNAAISFGLMMLVTLCFSLLVIYFGGYFGLLESSDTDWERFFLIRNLSVSAVIYAVVLRYFYIQQQWLLNLEAQSHAQVQALKARIRPHFLFNSMNTIASLVHVDANKAEKAVEDLSDLFRASLKDKTIHTLGDEIALTRSYMDIEQLRLGDRLKAEWQDDNIPLDMEIPALCLQPLVENAIYYGIEPLPEGGIIKIQAQIENNRLCLSVSNPVGSHTGMKNHKSNHMAQENIRKRLQLLYGEEAAFDISTEPGIYTVSLRIPVQRKA